MRIAALPWYDLPANHKALDVLWDVMRELLTEAEVEGLPTRLDRELSPVAGWRDPRLLLSQCCWPDLETRSGADIEPLVVPIFSDLDCEPGYYYSVIIRRPDAPERIEPRLAINSRTSQSGYFGLVDWLDTRGIKRGRIRVTGSHAASLQAVADGTCDMAAIDAFTWELLGSPNVVEVTGSTKPAPAPPWVTRRDTDVPRALLNEVLEVAVSKVGEAAGLAGTLVHPARR